MAVSSQAPNVDIPNLSITDFVLAQAARRGDKPALIDAPSSRTITYAELAEQVNRLAGGLADRNFGVGDVFAVYSPNVPEYAVVFLGVTKVGGILTTINPLYTVDELAKQLEDSRARCLLTVPAFLDNALAAAEKVGLSEVFVLGEAPDGAGSVEPFGALFSATQAPVAVFDPAEHVAVLPYSSGTTGLPKGVMLTHYNIVANLRQIEGMEAVGFECFKDGDNIIGVLPFFHIYGMVVIMLLGLLRGSTVVSMPRFDMGEFLEHMQKFKISIAPLVPPIVLGLAKHPAVGNYDMTNLRMVFSGAAPLGEDLARELSERLSCPVVQGYGMTEASPVTHLSPTLGDVRKPGSIGMVACNTEVDIIDVETGGSCPIGASGELLIRGPQIMKGYLNKPDATAESIDSDGWYHTGDIGYVDEDGYYFIVDRVKELIKYKGMQVAPAELEALLVTHPAVLDAAVIPRPDDEAGEIPKAFVVLKGDEGSQATSAESIMGFVAEKVAPHKRIRALEFAEAIPKSASGKILRRNLIEQERAAGKGATA